MFTNIFYISAQVATPEGGVLYLDARVPAENEREAKIALRAHPAVNGQPFIITACEHKGEMMGPIGQSFRTWDVN